MEDVADETDKFFFNFKQIPDVKLKFSPSMAEAITYKDKTLFKEKCQLC